MTKYAVRLIYPDLYAAGCPYVSVSYHIIANSPQEAEQKAFYYALAAVKDMLKRVGENPYTIDVVAYELIQVKFVRELEDSGNEAVFSLQVGNLQEPQRRKEGSPNRKFGFGK